MDGCVRAGALSDRSIGTVGGQHYFHLSNRLCERCHSDYQKICRSLALTLPAQALIEWPARSLLLVFLRAPAAQVPEPTNRKVTP